MASNPVCATSFKLSSYCELTTPQQQDADKAVIVDDQDQRVLVSLPFGCFNLCPLNLFMMDCNLL